MENSGTDGNAPVSGRWQNVAKRVADIIRVSGIEVFRQAVRQVTCDRLKTEDERARREEKRREALKKNGVLYRDGSIPNRPEGDWYFHQDVLGGYIKLPSKVKLPPQPKRPKPPACLRDRKPRSDWDDADKKVIDRFHAEEAKYNKRIQEFWTNWHLAILPLFEQVKKRGFPNDDNGNYRYGFDLCCWVPGELKPAKDPRNADLLPVPRRALTKVERIAVLAAVYDAHGRGSEKVAPWGLSEDGSDPDAWQADGERDEKRAAQDYFSLFLKAQRPDDSDLTIVESWLEELSIATKKAEPHYLDITLGDREASRIVNGETLTTKFERKVKPWELFRELYHASHDGLSKHDIAKRLWPPDGIITDNNLDQHKATANSLLVMIRVEIEPDNRGVWRLAELNS